VHGVEALNRGAELEKAIVRWLEACSAMRVLCGSQLREHEPLRAHTYALGITLLVLVNDRVQLSLRPSIRNRIGIRVTLEDDFLLALCPVHQRLLTRLILCNSEDVHRACATLLHLGHRRL